MYDSFLTVYQAFKRAKVKDPLYETLHLMDLLFNGAVRRMDFRSLDGGDVGLSRIVEERQQGRPLEYTLGRSTFMGLTLYSSPAAPIPRQEAELMAHTVLDAVDQRVSGTVPVLVIDVGTGSGHLAVALAVYSQHTYVLAMDYSQEALALAAKNVHRFGLQKRITLLCGERLLPLAETGYETRVDIVVGNKPACPAATPVTREQVLPSNGSPCAFAVGAHTIEHCCRLACEALDFLKPGGMLALETVAGEESAVCGLLETIAGYQTVRLVPDRGGSTRVITALRT
jgi:release factor glutamine methyltransferase